MRGLQRRSRLVLWGVVAFLLATLSSLWVWLYPTWGYRRSVLLESRIDNQTYASQVAYWIVAEREGYTKRISWLPGPAYRLRSDMCHACEARNHAQCLDKFHIGPSHEVRDKAVAQGIFDELEFAILECACGHK